MRMSFDYYLFIYVYVFVHEIDCRWEPLVQYASYRWLYIILSTLSINVHICWWYAGIDNSFKQVKHTVYTWNYTNSIFIMSFCDKMNYRLVSDMKNVRYNFWSAISVIHEMYLWSSYLSTLHTKAEYIYLYSCRFTST